MNPDEKLSELAAKKTENYSARKRALDGIKDKNIIWQLAESAEDEWIKLEAAIIVNHKQVLEKLLCHSNEQIRLESSIELNDQTVLKNIVLQSSEPLHREKALYHITNKECLQDIVEHSDRDKEKIEAALMLGDRNILKKLFKITQNEELQFRIAQFTNDYELLNELSTHATNSRIREMAEELAEVFDPECDID